MLYKTSCPALAALLALVVIAPAEARRPPRAPAAPVDPARAEAARLIAQAAERGDRPGGAVDLIRLAELEDWVPPATVPEALREAAEDPDRAPLVRAVGWWLLRRSAQRRLDADTAAEAAEALGLIDGFAMRPGPAPHPVAPLEDDGWQVYPRGTGAGALWLDGFIRPMREHRATVVTRLVSAEGGPAVLRLGYDDAATVWLNGDEVYVAPAEHPAWLDQAAIPVVLRPGDNRLVVEVRQRGGAWRLIARLTDPQGEVLPVESHPDPWGPAPDPAEGDAPDRDAIAHLWPALLKAADADPPVAEDLRDMADYARVTGLPDADQAMPRVAIEGTWPDDPGPRSLRAWLRLLPEAERARVRSTHAVVRPIRQADHWADLQLQANAAWTHYYAQRHGEARRRVEQVRATDPDFWPMWRLHATILQDLGLAHTAIEVLDEARLRAPDRRALRRAQANALRIAGRTLEALAALESWIEAGAGPDPHYQLAELLAARGDLERAVGLLDAVTARRPELWTYAVEAAGMLLAAGEVEAARARLEALHAERPGDETLAERLARVLLDAGARAEAQAVMDRARAANPAADLESLSRRIAHTPQRVRLGPPLDALTATAEPPEAPAQVLYHHARAEVGPDGRAERRLRRVVRILTEEGARRYGTVELAFVPSTQRIELEAARLYRAGEPPRSPQRSDRDLSDPAWRLYYDLRAEVLSFPKVQPGDVIEVAWRLVDTDPDPSFPGYYGELAWLQEAAPRVRSVVEVVGALPLHVELVDRGLSVRQAPIEGGARFEATDVPGLPLEPDMPGPSSVRAHVHASSAPDWTDVNQRYRALLADRDAPTEALATQARAWAGDARDPELILTRLYAKIAERVRYVGLEFGVHSFRPELPAVTLARGFGDCKDKATLLIAMARALGVDAQLTLVRTRPSGRIEPAPASLAVFDHAIVYVPGLDRFMDPTVDRNDPWNLPPSDQEAVAVVIGDRPEPRIVPGQPAAQNVDDWRFDVRLDGDRARGAMVWTSRGQPAALARRAIDGAADPVDLIGRATAAHHPGATVARPRLSGIAPALDPVRVETDVEFPVSRLSGAVEVPVAGGSWGLVRRFAQAATREHPLVVDYRRTRSMTTTVALAPGQQIKLPPPIALESPFGALEARAEVVTVDGQRQVQMTARWTLAVMQVEPADYPAFRAWLAAVDEALSAVVEIR